MIQKQTDLAALAAPERLPLRPPTAAQAFGSTLVVAPHPDDESLGCGGTIALLCRAGLPVHALIVTDGTRSHPNSRRFPAPALAALREQEALAALVLLGVDAAQVNFLRQGDCAVPGPGDAAYPALVERCAALLRAIAPDTVLLPWRRDPHCDHRSVWQLLSDASQQLEPAPRLVEYPIWVWTLAEPGDAPLPDEVIAWRLDIGEVLSTKLAAIAAHRSQISALIDDDPDGFRLEPEVLAHFERPWELFIEVSPRS